MRGIAIVLALVIAGLSGAALADPPAHAKGKGKGKRDQAQSETALGAALTAVEIGLIRDYFGGVSVPVEYQRAKPLPPGIQKNLARGKPLPPGIAKKVAPRDLVTRLPPRPGYSYLVVGRDVVLIQVSTNLVIDVLRAVIR